MKVTAVMVRVVTKPEYQHGEQRLLDSYRRYEAGYPHDLVIINRYGDPPLDSYGAEARYCGARDLRYDGGGWDCGAWQFAGRTIETDLLVCFNSSCQITGDNWLKRFVDAVEAHGEGLYGPLTSYEIKPHIRSPCMIFQPKVIQGYPAEVNSRDDTYRFESMGFPNGTPNFTMWAGSKGYRTMLVTWDGVYDLADWRKPHNIFRLGDQSNLIVKDRHCEAYEVSDTAGKQFLERLADGT